MKLEFITTTMDVGFAGQKRGNVCNSELTVKMALGRWKEFTSGGSREVDLVRDDKGVFARHDGDNG